MSVCVCVCLCVSVCVCVSVRTGAVVCRGGAAGDEARDWDRLKAGLCGGAMTCSVAAGLGAESRSHRDGQFCSRELRLGGREVAWFAG